jgi:hypothetical protein
MADCFDRSSPLAFCFVMFDQKDAMPMLIPAVVPHFFAAVPKIVFQSFVRGVQGKGEAARLKYKEIDPAKIVFHRNSPQYAANLLHGTGEGRCESWRRASPLKPAPWDAKTGCETPLARLNQVFGAMLPKPAVLDKPVLLKSGRNTSDVAEDNPGVPPKLPTKDAKNADTFVVRRANSIVAPQSNAPAPRSISLPR